MTTTEIIRFPAITPEQRSMRLTGLIGAGIQKSRSPAMHMQEAQAQGFAVHYQIIDLQTLGLGVEDLPALLDQAEALGFCGLNITYPCKQAVLPYLDILSDDARAIGAVNTVVFKDGKRYGYNTDCSGFATPLQAAMQAAGRSLGATVLLGTGGAGSAVAYAALKLGASRLTLVDREMAKATDLARSLQAEFTQVEISASDDIAKALQGADGLIHATPVGMHGHPGMALAADLLRPELWVAEVVYFPLQTLLVQTASAKGCLVVDGGGMAVHQAVGAFEYFHNRAADAGRMLQHFKAMLDSDAKTV